MTSITTTNNIAKWRTKYTKFMEKLMRSKEQLEIDIDLLHSDRKTDYYRDLTADEGMLDEVFTEFVSVCPKFKKAIQARDAAKIGEIYLEKMTGYFEKLADDKIERPTADDL